MTGMLWTAIFVQMALGLTDTLYHHEGTERLAWRPDQAGELRLHGVRNLAYAILFVALGWTEPRGTFAVALIALAIGELLVTLWDFVEEDRTRKLPASERILHTLLTLNYGAILAMLAPVYVALAAQPTEFITTYRGPTSWLCAFAAVGVVLSGLRDLAAARRCERLRERAPAALVAPLCQRKTVLVTGGTGFIGARLVAALIEAGHEVTVLTRDRAHAAHLPAPIRIITAFDQIGDDARIDIIINLAGEPLGDGRWTLSRRLTIMRSRLATTRALVSLIARLAHKPSVLISGSAIGWYGLRGDETLSEDSDSADCFSHRVCATWERAARKAEAYGVRVVALRIGLVLAADGGVLARMLTPFEFGLGGRFGAGSQWMSWIHRDDVIRLIAFIAATPGLCGPVNATAPEPVTNAAFAAALGRALRRPALLPLPAAPLRWALGAFATELLLGGQRVTPKAALNAGFRFAYPTLDRALDVSVGNGERRAIGHGAQVAQNVADTLAR